MGVVTQLYDPEGDDLIRRAELAGGAENLSEGERWRLENTLRRRKMQEAAGAQPRATDALASQRLEAIESQLAELKSFAMETLTQIIGEEIGEAENRSAGEAKKAIVELRVETDQKLNAQYSGFEVAVSELRGEDRRALLENLRETLADAESRIDAHLETALQKSWERAELEIALVRDELLNILAEKKYGQLDDVDPKLAEKAVRGLRRDLKTTIEKMTERFAALEGETTARLASVESEHRESMKKLVIRTGASIVAAQSAGKRADELAAKVERLEAEFDRLTSALLDQKVIR
jgi:hypothetical protein